MAIAVVMATADGPSPCSLLLFRAASAARLLLAALDPAAAAAGAIPVTGASCKTGAPKPASALAAGTVKEVRTSVPFSDFFLPAGP